MRFTPVLVSAVLANIVLVDCRDSIKSVPTPDFSGIYSIQSPDGYWGTGTVEKNRHGTYDLAISTKMTGKNWAHGEGVGMNVDGTLVIAWQNDSTVGLTVFKQHGGGMEGTWVQLRREGERFHETWSKMRVK